MKIDSKMSEARELLSKLGFDSVRMNDRSCRVLLALLDLKVNYPWKQASNRGIGVTPIMEWISQELGHTYKPNTRETIRRQTLHQFLEAGLIVINEDAEARATNSSKTNYKVTNEALALIRRFKDSDFQEHLDAYLVELPGLVERYLSVRDMARIQVRMSTHVQFTLSAGGQNVLIKQIVEEFCERFTPGAEIIYVGDTAGKIEHTALSRFRELGIEINPHGKLPDLVVYDESNNWLFLIEAASSHGPVDSKRYGELSELFRSADAGLVFISCFPNRETMRQYLGDLAWESEVWLASDPTHMIHFNGSKFLGPYDD